MISNWFSQQNLNSDQQAWSKKNIMLGILAYAFFSSQYSSQFATFRNFNSQHMDELQSELQVAAHSPDVPAPSVAPDLGHLLPGFAKPVRPNRPARAAETSTPSSQLTPTFEAIDRTLSDSGRTDDSGTNWSSIVSTLFSLGLILYVRQRMSQYAAKQTSKGVSWLGGLLTGLAQRATAPAGARNGLNDPVNLKPAATAVSAPYATPATVSGSTAPPRKTPAPARKSPAPARKSVVSRR